MTAFAIYLIKVIVCSALFAGCYWLALRNGRFYRWNRFCIVASVVLSIIIPTLNISIPATYSLTSASTVYITPIVIEPDETAVAPLPSKATSIPWVRFGAILFTFIVSILFVKEMFSFSRIARLKRRSERIRVPEAVLYCTDNEAAPFTFFRTIFWKKGVSVDSGESRCLIRHELAHVRLGHSWDKALMQLVCCLFWMNPFFILFRRELELVHEFEADSESSAEELSSMILCTLYPNHYHDFTSRFSQTNIKRRIFMISKHKNKKSLMNMLRKMSIVPVALVAMYLFGCKSNEVRQSEQLPLTPQNEMEEVVIVVGYGQLGQDVVSSEDVKVFSDNERKIAKGAFSYDEVQQKPVFQGKDNNFRQYVGMNMRYPAVAYENGITGIVAVSFVVDKNGNVTDVKSPIKIEYLSEELERVIQSSPAWKPGSQNGKDVAVQCYSFVEFKLQDDRKSAVVTEDEETVLYAIVKVKPTFNGINAETGFRVYVGENINYPAAAHENGISGRVYVEFAIDTDGSVVDVKLLRGVDPLLDAEALRVISSSPKWTPGKDKDGKTVKVKYQFPVNFRLSGETPSSSSSNAKSQAGAEKQESEEILFTLADIKPTFNGSTDSNNTESEFREYVVKSINYPAAASENGISGRVYVEFSIDTDGSVTDVKLLRGIDPLLDAEALRVVSSSPKWTPGKHRGNLVKVKYQFPVNFKPIN